MSNNSVIKTKNLGKTYQGRRVVRDINISVSKGEVVGLLGPNGAGKTTTFYMIMGLIKPDYGSIYIDDVDVTNLPVYKRARMGLGYLPQESSIFRGLSVEENIMAVLELSGLSKEERENNLEQLLGEFSISHLRKVSAQALSGGERRRLEIARCVSANPDFILLDEPLAGIDPIAIDEIKELIAHLKDKDIGIIITDHNVRETLSLAERVYIIHDGVVMCEGSSDEIVQNEEVKKIYLGDRFKY